VSAVSPAGDVFWALSSEPSAVIDADGVVLAANPAWAAVLGWEQSALIGEPLGRFLHPDDRGDDDTFRPPDRARVYAADGTVRDMAWSARLVGTTWYAVARERPVDHGFHQATLDSLDAQIAVLDADGVILNVNAAWKRFARDNGGERVAEGASYLASCTAVDDDGARRAEAGLRAMLAGTSSGFRIEYACHAPDQERWFAMRAALHRSDGPARIVVHHQDVTERVLAQRSARLRAHLLDTADVAVVATDLAGIVTQWTHGAMNLFGWTAAEALGRSITELTVPPAAHPLAAGTFSALLRDGSWSGDFVMQRKDGTRFHGTTQSTIYPNLDGSVAGLVAVSADVTHRVLAERELRDVRDHLRAVTDSMGEALITLDGDARVTYVNAVAEELLGWTRGEIDGRTLHETVQLGRHDATQPVRVEDETLVRKDGSEVSVAYTATPFRDGAHGTVIVMSDITAAKSEREAMLAEVESLAMVSEVRDALEEDRFVLHAQPIVDVATGAVVQYELLIRMVSREGQLIAPGAFLPAAERSGMIREIDRWVIAEGTRLAGGAHCVEINISAHSLGDAKLYETLAQALRSGPAEPDDLVLEITETALMADERQAREFVRRARGLGCRVALDDFGTGYGGFTQFKHLPVDMLKIDIDFVRDLATNPSSRLVVQAVVGLARGLGLRTVAEGVEDAVTYSLLLELGVDLAQGYHLGRPVPAEELLGAPVNLETA
jgi:PAS domain S-box-containing protein